MANADRITDIQLIKTQLAACGLRLPETGLAHSAHLPVNLETSIFVESRDGEFRISLEKLTDDGANFKELKVQTTDDKYRAIRIALAMYESI